MFDPLDHETRKLPNRLAWLRRVAWLSLFWERAAHAFWRPLFWIFFFIGLWLLQIPSLGGEIGIWTALLLFLAGLAWFLTHAIRDFSLPRIDDVDKRLEDDSGLPHRPLSHLRDRLANPLKGDTRSLWSSSRKTAFKTLFALKPGFPRPVLSREDPAALRFLVLVMLLTGIFVAGRQAPDRIREGLFPFAFAGTAGHAGDAVTLWITPPEYTGLPRIILQGSGTTEKSVEIPEGSIAKVRVSNGFGRPSLRIGGKKLPLDELGDKSWGLEATVPETERLEVRQLFVTRLDVPVTYIEDQPPEIALAGEPKALPKGELEIPLSVKDDYGITDLAMHMTLDALVEEPPLGQAVHQTRAVMSVPGEAAEIKPVYDLTWHSWAGLPVNISLEVTDHLGQRSVLPPIQMVLPERDFYHPVAKQLVEMRKRLVWTPEMDRLPLAYELEALLHSPGKYQNDITIFLSLRSMASRLAYDTMGESVMPVIAQLWDTALRIEDGNLTIAARNLRAARKNLEELLKDPNATDEQIAEAMAALQGAMGQYFQEIVREMQKRMAQGEQLPMISPEALENVLDAEDLAAFMDQLQAEALSGNRDSARQMLSQLQQLMDQLDPSLSMQMPPEMKFMSEGINELQELIDNQKKLLEQTREQAAEARRSGPPNFSDFIPFGPDAFEGWGEGKMPPPPQENPAPAPEKEPQVNTAPHQSEQDALRYILGELMLKAGEALGEIPQNMQSAEQEMRGSATQLGENRPDLSIPHQEQALEDLEQAQEQMQQQMAAMMKQMTFMSFGMGPTDPLGRPMDDGNGSSILPYSRIEIPDEAERKRAHEILELLRKRSGEFDRPDYELEYYRRLMRKF